MFGLVRCPSLCLDVMGCQAHVFSQILQNNQDFSVAPEDEAEQKHNLIQSTLEIDEYCDGFQKKWADKAQKPLEDQLNEVLAGLILAGEALRLRRIEREEEQRWQREQERRRLEDQERRYHLDQHREAWSQSQRLREFLVACEASLIKRKGEFEQDSPKAKWLRWAQRYADRIDPLKNGSFEEAIVRLVRKAESL